jgi:hypothetical protein
MLIVDCLIFIFNQYCGHRGGEAAARSKWRPSDDKSETSLFNPVHPPMHDLLILLATLF